MHSLGGRFVLKALCFLIVVFLLQTLISAVAMEPGQQAGKACLRQREVTEMEYQTNHFKDLSVAASKRVNTESLRVPQVMGGKKQV